MSDVTLPARSETQTQLPIQAVPAGNQTHALDDLRRRVVGRVHTPTDPTWDAARTPWVVNIPQHPMAVLEVHDADDVVAAVRWAVDHGCQVTAQPTGHGGLATLDQTLLLRTRALGGIEVDVQRRTVTIGSGVKAGELCAALEGTGLTFLCGSNADPSVTGMTITGGISWFGRAYGLGADSIVSVELVDGLGRVRRLDDWHDGGRVGQRPPGRLRRLKRPELDRFTKAAAVLPYLLLHDPDGRPKPLRQKGGF